MMRRIGFVALAIATIVTGLVVHWYGTIFSPALRDVLGDALWAMMIYWWLGAAAPSARPVARAAIALGICWLVELSQLYHAPGIDGWRRSAFGSLILGSGFDLRDLASYAIGVVIACACEVMVRHRRAH